MFKVGDRVEIINNTVWAGLATVTHVPKPGGALSQFFTVLRDEPIYLHGSQSGAFLESDLKPLTLDEYRSRVWAWNQWFNGVNDTK